MMFRAKSISRLSAFALAAVFALTLAGCGGGGGGGVGGDDGGAADPVDPPMTGPTEAEIARMIMDAKDDANEAAKLANAALETAKETLSNAAGDRDAAPIHFALATAELGRAKTAYENAQEAADKAQDADTLDDATKYKDMAVEAREDAEAARDEVIKYGGATSLASAQEAADMYKDLAARALANGFTRIIDPRDGSVMENGHGAALRIALIREETEEARNAADRAKAARMDYAQAEEEAKKAEAVLERAEAALPIIRKAAADAAAAARKAKNATTAEDARDARDEAKEHYETLVTYLLNLNGMGIGLHTGVAAPVTPMPPPRTPVAAHVLGLLKAANAVDVEAAIDDDPATEDIDESMDEGARAVRVMAVAAAIGAAAGTPADADNDSTTTGGSGATVTASWEPDTQADPPVEFAAGAFEIIVTPSAGGALTFRTTAVEADPGNSIPAMPQTATRIDGVSGFMHRYSISDGSNHAIVFTDIEQTVAAKDAVTIDLTISNKPVSNSEVVLADGATDLEGAAYDHDGDEDTNPVPAAFVCGSTTPTDCQFEIEDGELTRLVKYVVNVSENNFVLTAATDSVPDSDYLAFGVWLTDGDPPGVAAFAGGGAPTDSSTYDAALTGSATYTGKAAGLYTAGGSVDYFEGDASLTASFGMKPETGDDTANGTITGSIKGIHAGGVATGDTISLREADITDAGDFSGNARMGAGVIRDDDTVAYPYNGAWSGNFYGPATDDAATEDVVEGPANTAPAAVAGTFGVTGTVGEGDDAVTRSYVGAFGARR